jgi:hypothetical protein
MPSSIAFLFGTVGALAPEIVRLYSLRTKTSEFTWSWFYVAVSVLFGSLGGVLAIALPATTYWGAIYVGISTPVLVNEVLKKSLSQSDQMKSLPPGLAKPNPAKPSLRSFTGAL